MCGKGQLDNKNQYQWYDTHKANGKTGKNKLKVKLNVPNG